MCPTPAWCAYNPVSRLDRLGQHRAVFRKCVNRTPAPAIASRLGVRISLP